MKKKRTLGIILGVIGIVFLILAHFLNNALDSGRSQVRSGQAKVDTLNVLTDQTSYTKKVGRGATSSGQNKIDAGKATIASLEVVAVTLKVGGIILLIAGVGLVGFTYFRPRSR